jgi:predicted nucleotidyltransferase/HEPN domain-containing protein
MPPLNFMKTSLEHLPEKKRRELARVQEILFEEFDRARGQGRKAWDKNGRILKIVLFGSYARGDWVDEAGKTAKGYQSDYDLLIVVNYKELADMATYWYAAEDAILREKSIKTPVSLIVHSLGDVNDKLAHGQYFFVDIVRDGAALYELEGHRFVDPKPLDAKEAYETASEYFEAWSSASRTAREMCDFAISKGFLKDAAFTLHQLVERLYTCFLLTTTFYSPSTHNLKKLRSLAEEKDSRFRAVWLDENKFQRRSFERLKDAYVKARYSKHYEISPEELAWLGERVTLLAELVKKKCEECLATLTENAP